MICHFIENQNIRLPDQRTGNREFLPLPARQAASLETDAVFQSLRQTRNQPVRPGKTQRLRYLRLRITGILHRDILPDRSGDQEGILKNIGNFLPE